MSSILIGMKDNWKELQPHKIKKPSIEKRINQLSKLIQNPDEWNANIASRERLENLEKNVEELKDMVEALNKRIDGLRYLVKKIIGS